MSHVGILQRSGGDGQNQLYFFCAKDDYGSRTFYFVRANKLKSPILNTELKRGGNFSPKSYGEVILSGYGQPRDTQLARLHEEYQIDINAVKEIANAYN